MAFCKNCGTEFDESMGVCPKCGTVVGAAPNVAQNVVVNIPQQKGASTWDGGVLDTVVNSIVASLIMTVSCGIATPWAICYMMKYIISHAVVDGKRLSFDGTGGQLFGNWIKWGLLTIITCGIYSFWVTPRLYKWVCSHIHTEN